MLAANGLVHSPSTIASGYSDNSNSDENFFSQLNTEMGVSHRNSQSFSTTSNSNSASYQHQQQKSSDSSGLQATQNQTEPLLLNEPLLGGFALLRAVQLLNFDIYYLGLGAKSSKAAKMSRLGNMKAAGRLQQSSINLTSTKAISSSSSSSNSSGGGDDDDDVEGNTATGYSSQPTYYRTFLDELAEYNPLQKYIDRYSVLDALCKFLKICLSLAAIMIGFDKTISTIILCLSTKIDSPETSNSSMGLFVLILVNLSSMYILFSTVFNGHLLWNLLSQRLFLVSRKFQYKTMLCLLIFVYLEYIINISFVNNLYAWDFTSNNIQSGSYSVLANLRIIVTEQDEEHYSIDILLTILQFARGAIRISPYITINYAIICLNKHIHTIRNQHLLTDSLKKRQKLRLVVTNRRGTNNTNNAASSSSNRKNSVSAKERKKRVNFATTGNGSESSDHLSPRREILAAQNNNNNNKSNVVVVEVKATVNPRISNSINSSSTSTGGGWSPTGLPPGFNENVTSIPTSCIGTSLNDASGKPQLALPIPLESYPQQLDPIVFDKVDNPLAADQSSQSNNSMSVVNNNHQQALAAVAVSSGDGFQQQQQQKQQQQIAVEQIVVKEEKEVNIEKLYLARIRDFDELESYITNLYIFTGRLNRFMSRQGLTVFFIVHNLLISVSVIVPEAARGGIIMAYVVRCLVVIIGIVPFVFGQSLNSQLEQLSKQIDRIIIQQQFIHRRRDNLIRIRELIHDIRVNCGGMLNFNVESGIKYLVVAFASAFFIEQEHYKLTRRH